MCGNELACPCNKGVECVEQTGCAVCGWNPEVFAKRLEAVRRKYGREARMKRLFVRREA